MTFDQGFDTVDWLGTVSVIQPATAFPKCYPLGSHPKFAEAFISHNI